MFSNFMTRILEATAASVRTNGAKSCTCMQVLIYGSLLNQTIMFVELRS